MFSKSGWTFRVSALSPFADAVITVHSWWRGYGHYPLMVTPARLPFITEGGKNVFNNFADRIYVLRRLRGANACEIAYKVGVTPATVSAWECGKCIPHSKTILKITKAYNCTLGWLVGEDPIDAIEKEEKT